VVVDVRAHLDLFDLDDLLALARLVGPLLRLVLELADVEDLADRRVRVGRDLDEVEPGRVGAGERVADRNDPDIFAILIDETDLGYVDLSVDARALAGRRRVRIIAWYLTFSIDTRLRPRGPQLRPII
jgi:hypothetical protein